MGAFRGSISYTKFHVRGDLPDGFRDAFIEGIRHRAFRDLDPNEDVDHRVGWCSIEHPFDTDLVHEKVFFNDYLNLGFRVDRWRIPGPLLKASMKEAERRYLAEQGKERLRRSEKQELMAIVTATLRKKLVPTMSVVDLSWNLTDGVARFFHSSPRVHEMLFDLFEKTFDLELVQDGAYVAAAEAELPGPLLDRMTELEPFQLTGGL